MRKVLLFFTLTFCFSGLFAQLPNGSDAPDWTMNDLNGNSHHLYAYLDSGYTVYLDFSATWCGPCWNYHNSGALENLYETYGPSGTNEVRVFFIEGDGNTNDACLYGSAGCSSTSLGNWVANTPYPIINNASQTGPYQVPYWPTIYAICSNHEITFIGPQSTSTLYNFHTNCPVPAGLDITAVNIQNASCNGQASGAVTIEVTNGTGNYSYTWSNGTTNQNLLSVPAGTYSVTVTDTGDGKTGVLEDVIVGEASPLVLTQAFFQAVSCQGGGNNGAVGYAVSGGTPEYTYFWNTGATTSTISGLSPDGYGLTVTDANQCTAETIVIFNSPDYPVVNINPNYTPLNCTNTSTTLDGTNSSNGNGFDRVWSTNDGHIVSGTGELQVVVDASGTYTLTIFNTTTGCESTSSITVEGSVDSPDISVSSDGSVDCDNIPVSLIGSSNTPGVIYEWTGPNNYAGFGSLVVTNLPGEYTLTVSVGDCSASESIFIESNIIFPEGTLSPTNPVLNCGNPCVEMEVNITNATNVFYNWFLESNGTTLSTSNTLEICEPGSYNVIFTNLDNSCQGEIPFTVTEESLPIIVINQNITPITCANTTTNIDATASSQGDGFSYQWSSTQNGTILSGGNSLIVTVGAPGNYTLLITDQNNCSASSSVTVIGNTEIPSISINESTTAFTCDVSDIVLEGSSNISNVSFSWTGSNGYMATGSTITITDVGDYTLSIEDPTNGCQAMETVIIVDDSSLPIIEVSPTEPILTCANDCVVLSASSTAQNATYSWVNENGNIISSSASVSVCSVGQYVVTVENTDNGCINEFEVNVTQASMPSLSANVQQVSCFNGDDGSIVLSVQNGESPYQFTWNNGGQSATQTNLTAGTYSVIVTDNIGCQLAGTYVIEQPNQLNLACFVETNVSTQGGSDGQGGVTVSGGISPYSVNVNGTTQTIENEGGNTNFEGLASGTYTATVMDAMGCTSTCSFSISEPGCALALSENHTNESCLGDENGIINITFEGANDNVTFDWSNGETTQSIDGLSAGSYTVVATDEANCQSSLTVSISTNNPITPTFEPIGPLCQNGESYFLPGTSQEGISGVWNVPAFVPSNGTGQVVFEPTDVGCFTSTTMTIEVVECATTPIANFVANQTTGCLPFSVNFTDLSTNLPTSWFWSFPGGTPSTSTAQNPVVIYNTMGNYSVILTASNSAGANTIEQSNYIQVEACANECENPPTVNPGESQAICVGSEILLDGNFGGSATNAFWETEGTGTFDPNNQMMNATYTPSAADIASGQVVIFLYSNDPDGEGPCEAAVEDVTYTFMEATDGNAGEYETLCVGSDAIALSGSPTGGIFSGNFINNNTFNPEAIGTFTISYSYESDNGCTGISTTTIVVEACANECENPPTVNPGESQAICIGSEILLDGNYGGSATNAFWETEGTGTFDPNNQMMNATYTPSAADIASGQVVIFLYSNDPDGEGPCEAAVEDVTYTFMEATDGNAGEYETLCVGSDAIALSGSPTGGTFSGNFINNNTFNPEVIGTFTISYSYESDNGCTGISTTTIVVEACTNECENPPTVNAGENIHVCAGATATLMGVIGGGATEATWVGGTGTFTPNNQTLNAVYSPSGSEIEAGFVVLTLVTNDPDETGPCLPAFSTLEIIINELPALALSANEELCCEVEAVEINVETDCENNTLSWTDPNSGIATSTPIMATIVGDYTVELICDNGCTTTSTIEITHCSVMDVIFMQITPASNETTADGGASVTISGGTEPYSYVWTLNGEVVGEEQGLENVLPGTYEIVVTDANDCLISGTVVIGIITETDEPSWAQAISVYPNPSNGIINIELSQKIALKASIQTMLGQVIFESNLPYGKKVISLDNIAPGIYYLKFESAGTSILRKLYIED